MTPIRPLTLLFAAAALAGAQVKAPNMKEAGTRPGITFAKHAECKACARIATRVGELARVTFDERVAADVADAKPGEHHHVLRFFPTSFPGQGAPAIDLNEVRIKLLWRSKDGRPAKAGDTGYPVLKIGGQAFNAPGELTADAKSPAWKALEAKLTEFRANYTGSSRYGVPLILDAERGVSAIVFDRAATVAAGIYTGMRGLPRLPDAPAETRGKWDPNGGVVEDYDERLERSTNDDGQEETVEKPIIILEEEVELTDDVPKGRPFATPSGSGAPSVTDAYGVGGGAAGAFGQRWGKGSLAREGGSLGTEAAVTGALRWLKRTQLPDGSWLDGAAPEAKVVGTARALLAYMGNGQAHRIGTFKRTVNKGLTWLKRQQQADGSFGGARAQLLATQALAEAYAVTRDFTLKRYVEQAWAHLATLRDELAKDPALALCLHEAMQSAKLGGATEAQQQALTQALETAFGPKVEASRWEVTAGQALRGTAENADERLGKLTPSDARAWRWGTAAAFQHGGSAWKAWNAAMQKQTLPNQVMGGPDDGSWPAAGERSAFDVTVDYTLALESYYRYERAKR